jgi:hypothetical protein
MKKSFHGKLWYFGSDTLVETLAFRAAAFDAFQERQQRIMGYSAAKSWRNSK